MVQIRHRRLFGCLGMGLLGVFLLGLFLVFRVWTYHLPVDAEHLQAKRQYLEGLRKRFRSAGLPTSQFSRQATSRSTRKPNVIFLLFDDLGYGDLGAYGAKAIRTPHLDAVAAQGAKLTDFYAAAPVCSPSRAALMTGRYPIRTGLTHVVFPETSWLQRYQKLRRLKVGLPPDEITIADALQAAGYVTGLVGKWHLGGARPLLPNQFGFSHYFGVLCSNDQVPMHLFRDETMLQHHPINQEKLTAQYTQEAIRFLEKNAKRPFFLYLAHTFPHLPLHAAKHRRGKSKGGLYGDVVEELDASVGAIVRTLKRLGLETNTMLWISSDNGPWYQGSPGGHRGRKWEVMEGGIRVPLLVRWPGTIPAGSVLRQEAMNIDVFPTLLAAAGVPLPRDRTIDGRNLLPMLRTGRALKRKPLYFYWRTRLYALRQGNLKYHLRHRISSFNPIHPIPWSVRKGPWLFDLALDRGESYDVSETYKPQVQRFRKLAAQWNQRIRRNPRGWLPPSGRSPPTHTRP